MVILMEQIFDDLFSLADKGPFYGFLAIFIGIYIIITLLIMLVNMVTENWELVVFAPFVPIFLFILSIYEIFDKRGYGKEKAEYEKKRKETLGQLKEALTEGGYINLYPEKADTCIVYAPNGRVSVVSLACAADKCFRRKLPLHIQPGDDIEGLLASADAMVLLAGSHKEKASKKIIEKTRDRCTALKDARSLYFSKSNYILGFDSSGKVVNAVFDLPIKMLFTDTEGMSNGQQGFERKSGRDMDAFLADRIISANALLEKTLKKAGS